MQNQRSEFPATLYSPDNLIDRLCAAVGARSYSALGRAIDVSPSVLSKVRHRRLAISSEILLRMHESTGIPIRELRRWMGDNRRYFSPLPPSQMVFTDNAEPVAKLAVHVSRIYAPTDRTATP